MTTMELWCFRGNQHWSWVGKNKTVEQECRAFPLDQFLLHSQNRTMLVSMVSCTSAILIKLMEITFLHCLTIPSAPLAPHNDNSGQ